METTAPSSVATRRPDFNPRSIYRPSTGQRSFSLKLARTYGIKVAILAGLIASKCLKRLNERDGRFWYYNSFRKLTGVLPYLSIDEIRTALKKAEKAGLVVSGNYNLLRADRTRWYSAEPQLTADFIGTKLSFQQDEAIQFGLDAAVMMEYIRRQRPDRIRPASLSRYLPMSVKRIKKALCLLRENGMV